MLVNGKHKQVDGWVFDDDHHDDDDDGDDDDDFDDDDDAMTFGWK